MGTKRSNWNLRRREWIALDLLLSAGSMAIAYVSAPGVHFGWARVVPTQAGPVPATLIFPLFVLACGHVAGLHDPLSDRRRWVALGKITLAVATGLAFFLFSLYFAAFQQIGRTILVRTFFLTVISMLAARVIVWHLAVVDPKRIGLYLGQRQRQTLNELLARHQIPLQIPEVHEPGVKDDNIENVAEQFYRAEVSEVVVSSANFNENDGKVWMACLNRGIPVTDFPAFVERVFYRVPCQEIGLNWLVSIDLKWNHPFYHRFKRTLDLLVAGLGLIVSAPVIGIVAVLIMIETGRPVFYSQVRVGFRGAHYRIWKLRTMRRDAEAKGARWATNGDARVTRLGLILRRTRLDELPQFWNVLKGDMSLIGPRPERPEFIQQLTAAIPLFPQRHWIKPGITGWAQINYPYGASVDDAKEKLCYDLYYLKNATVTLDFEIALRTIGATMKGSR